MARRTFYALVIAAAVAIPLIAAPYASAAKNNYGVVVVHEDDSVDTECVRLSADHVRAFDLLQATTFDFYTQDFGDLGRSICYLDGEGYGPGTCFGPNLDDPSWSLWLQRRGKDPALSELGVSTLKVRPKSVIYMVFRPYEDQGGGNFAPDAPEPVSIKTICSA